MTEAVQLAIVASIPPTLAAVTTLIVTVWKLGKTDAKVDGTAAKIDDASSKVDAAIVKVDEIHRTTNTMKDELVAATKEAATLAGLRAGAKEEQARQDRAGKP